MKNESQHQGGEGDFEKELSQLKAEVALEKQRLQHLEEEAALEKKEIKHLEEAVEELEHKHGEHHHHEKTVKLIFIVNTTPVEITAELDWPLEKAVELALSKSGNDNRPIKDWSVKRGNATLNLATPIRDYHFRDCEELFVSLNAGQGGMLTHKTGLLCR